MIKPGGRWPAACQGDLIPSGAGGEARALARGVKGCRPLAVRSSAAGAHAWDGPRGAGLASPRPESLCPGFSL